MCSLCIVFSVVSLLVAKTYLSETVFAEEPALVNVAVNAVYASLTCILPHCYVAVIAKYGFVLVILGYHDGIMVNEPHHVSVVEVGTCVDKRFLLVSVLHHVKKLCQRVGKLFVAKSSLCLYINHGYEILVSRLTLCLEVFELLVERRLWAEKWYDPTFRPYL